MQPPAPETPPERMIASAGEAELEFKRSRFCGYAFPAADDDAAREHLTALRRAHPKATHHCSAWRLAAEPESSPAHHFDDDGEPGGTAGRPILQVLENQRVVSGGIVVVRYFGGTKLGAGGLVRAYAATATAALGAARLTERVTRVRLRVEVPFARVAVVEALIARHPWRLEAREFAPEPVFWLVVEAEREPSVREQLRDATAGEAVIAAGAPYQEGRG